MKLKQLQENELIAAIKKDFSPHAKDLILGIGDDAAVIPGENRNWIITKDLLIEDFHFLAASHPPALLGKKSLNVNISDIAAMGCDPRFALLGLGLPSGTNPQWIQDFFTGLGEAAQKFGVELIGGDVTQAEKITISVTLIGEGNKIIKRCGAKSGHLIYVSGTLGDSGQGLLLAKQGVKLGESPATDFLLQAFLDPIPQVFLGKELSRLQAASAMIDISDGLSVDLGHICEESRNGAELYIDRLPLSQELQTLGDNPLALALHGGEDYELLFTVPPDKEKLVLDLTKRFKLTRIGQIISGRKVVTVDDNGIKKPLEVKGYQHF